MAYARITCKVASEPWEFEQVHRLNYRTFVEEIPQHPPNPEARLVDRFHSENTYLVALRDGRVCGMVAVRARRPFSLDAKVADLDSYLPTGRRICEVRLLAVEPSERAVRGHVVMALLLRALTEHCAREGYNLGVISGVVRQQRLYRHLGFRPFGPLVGTSEALFQPMYATMEALSQTLASVWPADRTFPSPPGETPVVNLLPGPVGIHPRVQAAMSAPPVSHRADAFRREFERLRANLCRLVNARHVQVMLGTGTLANDAFAGQISLSGEPGLVLVNGEFGERLVDHACRAGLAFRVCEAPWGCPFDRGAIEDALSRRSDIRWLWAVHCETSTGVLNDLDLLGSVCRERGLRLCLDAVSSIGAVPVDLSSVAFATAVSGKGLGSFAGLCMVFHEPELAPSDRLPRYIDLGAYAAAGGVPFTQSSVLVAALAAALKGFVDGRPFTERAEAHAWLRERLTERGFHIVAPAACSASGVLTISLPDGVCSSEVGRSMRDAGYWLSFESGYLLRRNWVQVCLMGEVRRAAVENLPDLLWRTCRTLRQ